MPTLRNKDEMNETQTAIAQRIANAAREGNTEDFELGLQDLFQNINDQILASAQSVGANADAAVLARRGVRQLTNEETKFYNTFIEAARSNKGNPMMALTGADKTFPTTIIEQVMEDMQQSHPLLAAVDAVNTTGLTRFIINKDGVPTIAYSVKGTDGATVNDDVTITGAATWGDVTAAVEAELTSGFETIDLGQFKLSAFMPIEEAMLDLGPAWIDSYIRTCLSEALSIGYEIGIVTGSGHNMPIGMDRSVADDVTVTAGVYPRKDKIAITDLNSDTYGNLIAQLAMTQTGKPRAVSNLVMVVNPFDYFKLIMPGTTVLNANGTYVNDVLPYPTQVIQSIAVPQGEAELGMAKRYFLGVGGSKGIQFSDDYKFLDDKRYYKIVAYANGRPKDNNAFLRLDISGLKPKYLKVQNVTA